MTQIVESRARGKYASRGTAQDDTDAYSIRAFCRRHGISEAFYYKLRQQSLAPREMRLGSRVLISREAAAAWRRAREAKGTESATQNAPE
jgi:predicted DNA-binding transcriptional regulator AlpA